MAAAIERLIERVAAMIEADPGLPRSTAQRLAEKIRAERHYG